MAWEAIDLAGLDRNGRYKLLTGSVIPRPIAWVTSVDPEGRVNLAPFSFFNAFGANPAVVGFAPSLRRDGTKKDTLLNVENISGQRPRLRQNCYFVAAFQRSHGVIRPQVALSAACGESTPGSGSRNHCTGFARQAVGPSCQRSVIKRSGVGPRRRLRTEDARRVRCRVQGGGITNEHDGRR